MAEFLVHHTHAAEECGRNFHELQDVASALKGKTFFCTCPSGDHGGFFQVEAATKEAALGQLTEAMRVGASVYAGETMDIP